MQAWRIPSWGPGLMMWTARRCHRPCHFGQLSSQTLATRCGDRLLVTCAACFWAIAPLPGCSHLGCGRNPRAQPPSWALHARCSSAGPPARLLAIPPACPQSEIHDSYVTLHPTDLCNADIGAAQFDGLRQLAESSGSNATDLYTNGTVGYFVDWAAPVPVLSRTTKVASECRGAMRQPAWLGCGTQVHAGGRPACLPT